MNGYCSRRMQSFIRSLKGFIIILRMRIPGHNIQGDTEQCAIFITCGEREREREREREIDR